MRQPSPAEPIGSTVSRTSSARPRLSCETRVLGGRYRVRRLLGRGGVADVYLGDDLLLERAVAIKILYLAFAVDASVLTRFRREAVMLAAVRSPHVVGIYDIGLAEESVYLVMQQIEGRSIEQEIARRGPMPQARAERVITQLLDGLAEMHRHGLVHRQINPSNVLLDRNDDVVLLDLGIVLASRQAHPTVPGRLAGTPGQLAPVSPTLATELTIDVYQVGLLMLFLLTGVGFTRRSQRTSVVDLLQRLPVGLADVARRALHADPAERFPSAATMKEAVATALERSAISEPKRSRSAPSEPRPHLQDREIAALREPRATSEIPAAQLLALLTDARPATTQAPAPVVGGTKTTKVEAAQIVSARPPSNVRETGRAASEHMRTPLLVPREAATRGRILIVDEDVVLRATAHRMLAPVYQVFVANDARHARTRLEAGERFNVILCGLVNPMELHEGLMATVPDQVAAIVFITSSTVSREARAFLDRVTNKRLSKPLDVTILKNLIDQHIASARRAITSR